ncbi:uncharacterized protein LOC126785475 isoform X2 [Argentina anserina]|uniref:uncharacterized protein LOC126785475 isoform X2 n=1 Tax=Argentina anserina TaxID=57926 RepID=UPI002176559F|nr:uncharacterized protein LOC126785475 isoform X2 [Potentilla anserina]
MMLRLCYKTRRYCSPYHHRLRRRLFSTNPIDPPTNLQNANQVLPPPPPTALHRRPSPIFPTAFSRKTFLGVSAAIASVAVASYAVVTVADADEKSFNPLYDGVQGLARQSAESCRRIIHHAKQTGVTASVLWHSLRSVLSSANHEVRSGFQLRVAALLADISAANASRRAALVGAGGGAVVDWLLESVAVPRDGSRTQAESARALAFLIADPNVSAAVLGRPNAVPNLLRFIYSCQPKQSSKSRRISLDVADSLRGRSMLVAAIMDIVTSHCDSSEKVSFKPSLPGKAAMRDIAATLQVIEDGGMRLDDSSDHEGDEDGDSGIKGIGIKVLGGTSVLGLSRTNGLMELGTSDSSNVESGRVDNQNILLQSKHDSSLAHLNLPSAVIPGLWDDLTCQHVAVPFAAWALANWAMASEENRSLIQELDADGNAVMTALMAPERSVKWHGSLVARLLLEDDKLPVDGSVSDWSSSLLSTASQATKNKDIPLAQVALSAFLVSVEKSPEARKIVMEKGLHLIRDTAKRTKKHKHVQEALAKALELLCTGELHLSLQEGQKWSGVLLPWVFRQSSSDAIRISAIKILSRILEDYGPHSVPISQGWLATLLTEILDSSKASSVKGNTQPKSDKVKTQIDQSNILSAAQTANQLVAAVVNLAVKQLGTIPDSVVKSPLADLLSMEPFSAPLKTLKKDSVPKVDVADSAMATLKGIKALTEVCSVDSLCQEKIVDFGVLCLLRRFLLRDDYEKLSAIEAYDASKTLEAQDRTSNITKESSTADSNDPSSVRVPPTAHIRRHAARLLTLLSLLPKVQKVIIEDETWCKWLEDCANGKISGCSDLKIQSYARATLLNILCNHQIDRDSANGDTPDAGTGNSNKTSPRYGDNIFLINPESSHWKCPEKSDQDTVHQDASSLNGSNSIDSEDKSVAIFSNDVNSSSSGDASHSGTGKRELDIVFVHGLRGGPYKTWRIAEDKSSTKSGIVEKIDQEAGKLGTFWPGEWLSADFPQARMFTLRYKSSLTQWSGATLPLQEVSSMLLEKIVAAGIGDRPVVFVTHSMGGLVVKQILSKAKSENINNLVNNTVGIVFYSCPHFGSKLADMPWKMGFVLRPAPTIGELISGSPRLLQLNDYIRHLHKKGSLEVLSFCETKVTPIVEGYGGWAFRMEIVPIESAYPGFGDLVVLESTDHINSCKPLSRSDPSYTEILEFLRKLKTSKQTVA